METIGDNSLSIATVSCWFCDFIRGWYTLQDASRHELQDVNELIKIIIATEKLTKENRNISYREIQEKSNTCA